MSSNLWRRSPVWFADRPGQFLSFWTGSKITPHPNAGLQHLAPWFGNKMVAAGSKALILHLPAAVVGRPYRDAPSDPEQPPMPSGLQSLNGCDTLSASMHALMLAMCQAGVPTVERLARAAGLALRTLQRRWQAEGTSFSRLLEEVRRETALAAIAASEDSVNTISNAVGFARQSALARAVRRCTGQPPRQICRAK